MLLNKKNNFDDFGYMIDCSRGAVPTIESLKKLVDILSAFGYNYLMLYTEDTYEIEGEPYFGYMRGRYSKQQIQELDKYCISKNMELRACIQTLAHLSRLKRHVDYEPLYEINDILTVKDERVYTLIDKMFDAVSKMFSSKKIHIGMDEAWALGRGKLLDKYGALQKSKIMNSHLKRVSALAEKYGFECDIWADMLWNSYHESNDKEHFKMQIPENITPIIWRYWLKDSQASEEEILTYKKFCDCKKLGYAGGAQKWSGFIPSNRYSFFTFEEQMSTCIKHNVKRYLITAWGDCGADASMFSTIPSMFYASLVAHKLKLNAQTKRYFKQVVGMKFDDFMNVDLLSRLELNDDSKYFNNLSFIYLYNDLLQGMYDEVILDNAEQLFTDAAKILKKCSRNENFGYIFKTLYHLSYLVACKVNISKNVYEHYNNNDKVSLKKDVIKIKKSIKELNHFMNAFETQWHIENNSIGYEKQIIRLGGLKERLEYTIRQINRFLDGQISKIDELEEKRLPISNKYWDHENKKNNCLNSYCDIVSGGSLKEF